jgi:death-on-curing protein
MPASSRPRSPGLGPRCSVANHALVDGNKRLGFACAAVFLQINGAPLTLDEDAAYELVISVAEGALDDVETIAQRLRGA